MARRLRWAILLSLLVAALVPAGASAAAPPWCGTPETDAAANLPDGSQPTHPVGSFPHIPYYAIGCTLRDIESRSDGRMRLQVIGKSATGRDMYGVVINRLETRQEKRDYVSWLGVRALMLREPIAAQKLLRRLGDDVKVPVFIQGGIHGNEYEGVDAAIDTIEKFATTPYGTDPKIDAILSHTILVFNPIQNPDGRVAGTRQNGNGFDLNRDYMTQSQSEVIASIGWMKAGARHGRHARLRDADADRGDDQAAQPEHRVRQLAQVEPAADRLQRGRAERGRPAGHAADQRLVPGGRRADARRRAVRRR